MDNIDSFIVALKDIYKQLHFQFVEENPEAFQTVRKLLDQPCGEACVSLAASIIGAHIGNPVP
eukprot:Pgem_evm1s18425